MTRPQQRDDEGTDRRRQCHRSREVDRPARWNAGDVQEFLHREH